MLESMAASKLLDIWTDFLRYTKTNSSNLHRYSVLVFVFCFWQYVYVKWRILGSSKIACFVTTGCFSLFATGLPFVYLTSSIDVVPVYWSLWFMFFMSYLSSECLRNIVVTYNRITGSPRRKVTFFDEVERIGCPCLLYIWGYHCACLVCNLLFYFGVIYGDFSFYIYFAFSFFAYMGSPLYTRRRTGNFAGFKNFPSVSNRLFFVVIVILYDILVLRSEIIKFIFIFPLQFIMNFIFSILYNSYLLE